LPIASATFAAAPPFCAIACAMAFSPGGWAMVKISETPSAGSSAAARNFCAPV
jgi:hypothetical protein